MIKYKIYTDSFEFRIKPNKDRIPNMSADAIFGTYWSCDTRITSNSLDPCLRGVFDNEADAMAAWETYKDWGRTYLEKGQTQWLLRGVIAWMESAEYCGKDYDYGLDYLCVSAEPYIKEEDE
jgi:hypothetical protein